ncbi:3-hydroxyisobutyryl-CoA hydrolase isoform X2 [Oratosquilla oratoria]|uniref:3-hydroxyisobutyryl-CoA hydrolase isoform X2 n=1 Tax=Oratosquilla oratoria TaxID=337810 RepID=UPI003F76264B
MVAICHRMTILQKILGCSLQRHQSLVPLVRRMCSSGPDVLLEDIGNKGLITLNRPKALNALNLGMVRTIYPKLQEWENNKSLVIIKGVGEKAFCAGGDVRSITEGGKKGDPITKDFFREEYYLNCLIGTLEIPYIALLDGITMGGGVGLSVHGMFRIATERSLFAMPETAIGLFPDVGGSHFLPRIGGNLGMYLALTGHRLKGRDVLKAGVATHVCDAVKLPELEDTLLKLENPYPEDVSEVLNDFHNAATFEKDKDFSLKPFLPQIEECFSADSVEGIIDRLQKDGSEWALKNLSILSKMSPTSLKVTHEQITRGADLTLQECLAMEYRLTQRCCEDHDFYEGVRAVLVDKDQKPSWNPANLEGVDTKTIERYFSPLPPDMELKF